MSDDFLDSLIKIRANRNGSNHDVYQKNGFLTPYNVMSPTQSSSLKAQAPERVPRLLFFVPKC